MRCQAVKISRFGKIFLARQQFIRPANRIPRCSRKTSLAFFPEDDRNRRLRREDSFRHLAHFLRGEFFEDFREQAVGVGGVAKEEVEGGVAGVGGNGLLLDGGTAEDGGADAFEGVGRDAFGGDFRDLLEQLGAGEVELLRRGGKVEGEEAAVVAEELGGADAVGEAELLADAPKSGPAMSEACSWTKASAWRSVPLTWVPG